MRALPEIGRQRPTRPGYWIADNGGWLALRSPSWSSIGKLCGNIGRSGWPLREGTGVILASPNLERRVGFGPETALALAAALEAAAEQHEQAGSFDPHELGEGISIRPQTADGPVRAMLGGDFIAVAANGQTVLAFPRADSWVVAHALRRITREIAREQQTTTKT